MSTPGTATSGTATSGTATPGTAVPDRWFPGLDRTDRSRPRLFCFPAAGGNTGPFYRWRRSLADLVQVVPVELPGHRQRLTEPAHRAVPELVDELLPPIRTAIDGPFALLGTSLGALVAFETARQLVGEGMAPDWLLVASCPSPRTPWRGQLHQLPDAEFLRELGRMRATPPEVLDSPDLTELLLPAWRADFTLVETYRYRSGPPLPTPLVAVAATDDPYAPVPAVHHWRAETAGSFSLVTVDSGHFFFLEDGSTRLPELVRELVSAREVR